MNPLAPAATATTDRRAVRHWVGPPDHVTAGERAAEDPAAELRAVAADLTAADRAALDLAVDGADAVLSAFGPRSASEIGIAAQGTRAIVDVMQATGVRGIVVVSSAPVSTVSSPGRPESPSRDPSDGFFMHHAQPFAEALGKRYADLALIEDVFRESDLGTVVRPPQLTDGPLTGRYPYRTNLRRGLRVA